MKKFSHTRGYIGLLVAHLSLFPWHEATKELALWVVGRDWSFSIPHQMLRFVLFCSFAVQLSWWFEPNLHNLTVDNNNSLDSDDVDLCPEQHSRVMVPF